MSAYLNIIKLEVLLHLLVKKKKKNFFSHFHQETSFTGSNAVSRKTSNTSSKSLPCRTTVHRSIPRTQSESTGQTQQRINLTTEL